MSAHWMEVENHKEMRAKRYYFSTRAFMLKACSQVEERLPGWVVRDVSA